MRARSAMFKAFVQANFTLVRMTNHAIWRCPCGHTQLTAPTTPGKARTVDNNLAMIARTLRACQKLKETA